MFVQFTFHGNVHQNAYLAHFSGGCVLAVATFRLEVVHNNL